MNFLIHSYAIWKYLNTKLWAAICWHHTLHRLLSETWWFHDITTLTFFICITNTRYSFFLASTKTPPKPSSSFHILLPQCHSENTPTWLLLHLSSQGLTLAHPLSPSSTLSQEHGISSSSHTLHTPSTETSKSFHLSPSVQCTPHVAPTRLPHPPKLNPATTPSPSSTRGFAANTARRRFSERWWTRTKRGSTCGWWRSSSRRGCRSWRAIGRAKMGSLATGSTLTRCVLGTMLCTRKWGLGGLLGYGLILLRMLHKPLSMFSSSMPMAWQNYLSTRLPKCSIDIVCEFFYPAILLCCMLNQMWRWWCWNWLRPWLDKLFIKHLLEKKIRGKIS